MTKPELNSTIINKTPQLQNQAMSTSPDIGSKLLEKQVISVDQLNIALKERERIGNSKSLGVILVDMGFISEGALGEILNESAGIKKFDLKASIVDSKIVRKIPKDFAVHNKLIPVMLHDDAIIVAMVDVFDIIAIDQMRRFFPPNYRIDPVFVAETEIMQAIDQYFDYEMSIEGILREIEGGGAAKINDETQLRGDYKSPMVRLVDAILNDAVHHSASDLHFEPEAQFLRIRYRIDGKMVQIRSMHKDYWSAIVVRIKIMSGMNIAETRKPQDGRIESEILGRKIDFRVSTQPTINGENIVMRILDEKQSVINLDKLGFSEHCISILKKIVKRPEGVIILTGPTGSGKTTTLYTLLNFINSIDKNIMTLEDPVEYHIPLIRQSNIKNDIGMDFAAGIKAILRQDPDVILVGEIRDKETAITAIQSAMTGHQVFTSLHTNDALSAIPRLMNIGVPNYLMAGSLIGIIAQRLARKLCPSCKIEVAITDEEKKLLGAKFAHVEKLYQAVGCDKCSGIGYKGRTAVAEILPFDRELDEMVVHGDTRKEMFKYALSKGFITMVEDGLEKVVAGMIDLKELIRVVDLTDRM
jgi:general secretion pathway protein E/type IV pilus assembly protein PilB